MEFHSEREPEEVGRRTGADAARAVRGADLGTGASGQAAGLDARASGQAAGLGARVLALQRQVGNAAVVRELQRRTLARDQPWSFSPLKPAPPDLRPWDSKDPAVRARWERDMWWLMNRPNWVTVTVNATGLKDAVQKPVTAAEAQAQNAPAPAQAPSTAPDQAQPGTVPVVQGKLPEVKGVQIGIQYGLAGEAHTKQGGPGADPAAPQTDWQSSAQVALTVVYHDDGKPGWEWSTQVQVAWSDTGLLRSLSPTALQSVQIGSQLAYVMELWKNVQLQIFGQLMFGVTADGKPVAQVSGGAQLQLKLGKGFSLFVQGGLGGTEGSGAGNAPNYTGDASVQGGIMYQFP